MDASLYSLVPNSDLCILNHTWKCFPFFYYSYPFCSDKLSKRAKKHSEQILIWLNIFLLAPHLNNWFASEVISVLYSYIMTSHLSMNSVQLHFPYGHLTEQYDKKLLYKLIRSTKLLDYSTFQKLQVLSLLTKICKNFES